MAKRQLHIIVGGRVGDFKIKGVTYCNRQPNILSLEEGKLPLLKQATASILRTQGQVPDSDGLLLT